MRLPCPFCGTRDSREFTCRGDAAPLRPQGGDMHDYVYLRDNRAGVIEEFWYHMQGCRQWLRVTRDTRTHEIVGATMARGTAA
jgi:methylglutamate dehydrogenase subunit B